MMTERHRLTTALLAALLLSSLLIGGVAAAGAGATAPPAHSLQETPADETADAELSIRQPHYIDGDVREQTENGTAVYLAQGERLYLTPSNFDTEDVTDHRVRTEGGALTFDDDHSAYVFEPDAGEGTYDLEWSTETETEVTVEDGNETTTETRTVSETYTAKLRVDGGVGMEHLTAEESERRQHYTELGQEVNATNQELRERGLPFATTEGNDYEMYQAQVERYVNTGNPIGLLSGNLGAIVTMIVLSLGGWLLVIAVFGGFGNAIRKLKKKLHIHESIEDEEGKIADRQAETKKDELIRALQNVDWNDWYEDDAMADWMRDSGENPHDGIQALTSGELCPSNWMRDRLHVMGEVGYQARVSRAQSPITDGGETAEDDAADTLGEIVEATLATPDADGDDLEPIADLDIDQLVDAIDWEDSVLWNDFRLPEADVDFDDLEREPLTMDLDATMNEANLQVERFPNKRVAGQCLRELIESVEEHEYTDVSGRPQTIRGVLNTRLKTFQKASDRHRMPVQGISEAIEQALINHDPNEEARQAAREVRSGAD